MIPTNRQCGQSDGRGSDRVRGLKLIAAIFLAAFFLAPTSVFAVTAHLRDHAPRFIAKTEGTYGEYIKTASLLYDTDPDLILAMIVVESEGNPQARSHRGAVGLMQLMPRTAKAMGVTNAKEPLQNILAGTKYLKELEETYAFINSDEEALVAYNMGPSKAKRWLARAAPEKHPYVSSVMYVYELLEDRERSSGVGAGAGSWQFVEEFTRAVSTTAQPLMSRPRSLSLAAFPMSLPSGRREEVQLDD